MCVCLFSALSRRVGALQMPIIIIITWGLMSSHVRLTYQGQGAGKKGGGGGGGEGGEWMTGNETNEMFSNTGAQGCPGITSCIPMTE